MFVTLSLSYVYKIDNSISDRLKDIFVDIAPNYGVELLEWNHDIDHVHLLFKAKPN
ncbi:transposase, partial [Clostridioides sp. ZZV14-6009]|nr:transposase [Clostridioides sp. ZZV14-6009]